MHLELRGLEVVSAPLVERYSDPLEIAPGLFFVLGRRLTGQGRRVPDTGDPVLFENGFSVTTLAGSLAGDHGHGATSPSSSTTCDLSLALVERASPYVLGGVMLGWLPALACGHPGRS